LFCSVQSEWAMSRALQWARRQVTRWTARCDFEFALWQGFFLVVDPKRVYRTVGYHYQTKGHWSRDDPAFLLLLAGLIVVASFSFGLAFFSDAPLTMLRIISWTVFVDLVATGVLTATLLWWASNRWLRDRGTAERVEWAYCFDVHCNSWFVLFLYVYVLCYVLLPALIVPHSWISTLLANTLYAAATTHYMYATFVGYSSLPFLRITNTVFIPAIAFLVLLVLLTLLLKFNVVIFVMNLRYAS